MDRETNPHPWEELAELIWNEDTAGIERFWLSLPLEDVPRVLDRLSSEDRAKVLQLMNAEQSAVLMEYIPAGHAGEIIEKLPPSRAAAILQELPSDEKADLLNEVEAPEARAILAEMEPDEARQLIELSAYPGDVAGGLMIAEFVAYPEDRTVAHVIEDLREHRDRYESYNVLYAYVTDEASRLTGVLRLRNVLLSPAGARLG